MVLPLPFVNYSDSRTEVLGDSVHSLFSKFVQGVSRICPRCTSMSFGARIHILGRPSLLAIHAGRSDFREGHFIKFTNSIISSYSIMIGDDDYYLRNVIPFGALHD